MFIHCDGIINYYVATIFTQSNIILCRVYIIHSIGVCIQLIIIYMYNNDK